MDWQWMICRTTDVQTVDLLNHMTLQSIRVMVVVGRCRIWRHDVCIITNIVTHIDAVTVTNTWAQPDSSVMTV